MQDIPSSLLTRLREAPATLTADERDLIAKAASDGTRQRIALLIPQREAASLLGINRTTIWRLVRDGIVIPIEVVPGTLRYRRDDIEILARHGWKPLVAARRKVA